MHKQKKVKKVSYICAIYGGKLRLGIVRYFATENSPECECEKYKEIYGKHIKFRYIKVNESYVDSFKKLKDFLKKQENIHDCGNLYNLPITRAVELMKEALDVKKSSKYKNNNSINLLQSTNMLFQLRYVKEQTPELCKMAITKNGLALEYVKKEQAPKLCEIDVNQNGYALELIKEQTPELCEIDINQNGYALELVKEQIPELCKMASQQNHYVFEFVKQQTHELCKLANEQNSEGWAYTNMELSPELYKFEIEQCAIACALALEYVPEQTPDLCKFAIEHDFRALKYVKKQTHDLCKFAIEHDFRALKYVRDQTSELCELAINQNIIALKYVKKQTPESCEIYINKNGYALELVKEQTPELCMIDIKQNNIVLKFVKIRYIYYNLWRIINIYIGSIYIYMYYNIWRMNDIDIGSIKNYVIYACIIIHLCTFTPFNVYAIEDK